MSEHGLSALVVKVVTFLVAALTAVSCLGCSAPSPAERLVDEAFKHAEGLDKERAEALRRSDLALFSWAAESGLEIPKSFSVFTQPASPVGPGAAPSSAWQRYREAVLALRGQLKDEVKKKLTVSEAEAYYTSHLSSFARQDTITVRITWWENNRAGKTSTLTIDESNVRALQEYDDALIAAALSLQKDERSVVDLADGRQAEVFCTDRKVNGAYPFAEVADAAATQLAEQRVEEELQRRAQS